jgi:hypothetical protein
MRRLDRRGAISFIDASDPALGCPADREAMLARFLLSGAAAFAAMWRAIPVLWPLGVAARNPLVLAGLERLYRGFLRIRPQLQALARQLERRRRRSRAM